MPIIHSDFSGLTWPSLSNWAGNILTSLEDQLDQTEWWPEDRIRDMQFRQIRAVVAHFEKTSPYIRQRQEQNRSLKSSEIIEENFSEYPILTRADLHDAGHSLLSTDIPKEHGAVMEYKTSGTTGKPLSFHFTALAETFHHALMMRNNRWQKRDTKKTFAIIRRYLDHDFGQPPEGAVRRSWCEPYVTGNLVMLNTDVCGLEEQLTWLKKTRPAYLQSYASNLASLAQFVEETGDDLPWLEGLSAFGEALTPVQRATIERIFGVPLDETYGSTEAGMIAFQAPNGNHLLVQSENLYVEILDESGANCSKGQVGRVIVTDLHNFATPVLRYDTGDFAAWGDDCPDGRGLRTIDFVAGRSNNLLRLPDGKSTYPLRWTDDPSIVAPIRDYQILQTSQHNLIINIVTTGAVSAAEEIEIMKMVERNAGGAFTLTVKYVDVLQPSLSGKFDSFRCDMAEHIFD